MKKESVFRHRAGGRDRAGKPKPTEPEEIKGVVVVPRRSGEGEQGTIILDGWRLFLPKGTSIVASDLIEVRGKKYGIIGNPGDYGKKVIVNVESTGSSSGA